jgi:mono/diheme cytochrome c family protein
MFTPARYQSGASHRTIFLTAFVLAAFAMPSAAQTPRRQVTYNKDIAPILERSCQSCHRPDSVAPMSLLTYEQARPYARAMKLRTSLRDNAGSRGVMPPWYIEKNIGIQSFKEDISLSDEQIATIAAWADSGAPEGNPADRPAVREFAQSGAWHLGKPDMIVSSPKILVKGVAPDWWGDFGETPSTAPETRYAKAVEYREQSDLKKGALGADAGRGKTSIFVFHHASVSLTTDDPDAERDGEAGGSGLSLHEVGRNGDVFNADAGKIVPRNAMFGWNGHLHAPGIPGADRTAWLELGIHLHPSGYKPKYVEQGINFGKTEIDFEPQAPSTRFDAYWVAPQPIKLLNYEPHMHATGIRKCIEAIYGGVAQTLNCAGYDHNWVKNYQYDDNAAPLLPAGTILHAIGWFDNSAKNPNNVEPRNPATYGANSVSNMFILFNKAIFLTAEQYQEELAKRRQHLQTSGAANIGCPDCYRPAPTPGAGAAAR